MITNTLISLVATIVSAITNLLPHLTVPAFFTTNQLGTSIAGTIGSLVGVVHAFIPVVPMLIVIAAVMPLWLLLVAYLVFQWVWNHIPTIAGFGTH